MNKISNKEIIDVIKFSSDKIIIVEKIPVIEATGFKANYYIINLKTGEKEAITKNAYLMKKFGASAYRSICEVIANFVQCDSVILPNRDVFIIFPNGQCGLFDSNGEIKWNKTLTYNESSVNSLAADGDCIWCCCKEENCVIRYFAENAQFDLRIGSKEASTFSSPFFVSSDENSIYVCCEGGRLRSIDRENFTVTDVSTSIPGLKSFYRFGRHSLICTTDGAYITEE